MYLIFLQLYAAYCLCDTAFQSPYIYENKIRIIDGVYNPQWYISLTAHSLIHAGAVGLITHSFLLASVMLVAHWLGEFAKAEGYLKQLPHHIIQILILTFIGFYFTGYLNFSSIHYASGCV